MPEQQRIKEAAEQAKKELSSAESTHIVLPYLAQKKGEPIHLDTTLTRNQFYGLIKDLIERTDGPVKNAVKHNFNLDFFSVTLYNYC